MNSQIRTDEFDLPSVETKKLVTEELKSTNQSSRPIFSSDLSMSLFEPSEKRVDIRKLTGADYLEMLLGDEEKLEVDFVKPEETYNVGKSYDFSHIECEVFPEFNYKKLDKDKLMELEVNASIEKELLAGHELHQKVNEKYQEEEVDELEKRLAEASNVEDIPEGTNVVCNLAPVIKKIEQEVKELTEAASKPSLVPEKDEQMTNISVKKTEVETKKKSILSKIVSGFLIMLGLKKQKKVVKLERGTAKRFLREELESKGIDFKAESSLNGKYGDELQAEYERGQAKRFLRQGFVQDGVSFEEENGDEEDGDYEEA